ncbi:MAG: hypothetical protein ACPL1D_00070 [Microgenomates group bacterium]
MDFRLKVNFKKSFIDLITSLIFVFKNFFGLIFFPYKTLRRLSFEKDYYQSFFIFFLIFCYFKFVYFLKDKPYPATFNFLVFFANFFLTLLFFYYLSLILNKKRKDISFLSLFFTFSYSLFPTLIWFGSVSFLYIILPPPRTTSTLGIFFSIFFLAYSFSLLAWKLILVFLSLRFSLKLNFYQIIYLLILYLLWFLPYSIILYRFKIFKIPFI